MQKENSKVKTKAKTSVFLLMVLVVSTLAISFAFLALIFANLGKVVDTGNIIKADEDTSTKGPISGLDSETEVIE